MRRHGADGEFQALTSGTVDCHVASSVLIPGDCPRHIFTTMMTDSFRHGNWIPPGLYAPVAGASWCSPLLG